MTIEQRETTVQTNQEVPPVAPQAAPVAPEPTSAGLSQGAAIPIRETFSSRSTVINASGAEMARRIVAFVFGLIQAVIVLRIVLLLLDARTGNDLVAGILNVSKVFVGPFDGILNTNALSSGGSVLDLAAVVAIIGWTVVEFVVFAGINLFRHDVTAA